MFRSGVFCVFWRESFSVFPSHNHHNALCILQCSIHLLLILHLLSSVTLCCRLFQVAACFLILILSSSVCLIGLELVTVSVSLWIICLFSCYIQLVVKKSLLHALFEFLQVLHAVHYWTDSPVSSSSLSSMFSCKKPIIICFWGLHLLLISC